MWNKQVYNTYIYRSPRRFALCLSNPTVVLFIGNIIALAVALGALMKDQGKEGGTRTAKSFVKGFPCSRSTGGHGVWFLHRPIREFQLLGTMGKTSLF